MTSSIKMAHDASQSIMLECDLPHRPAKVWRALTDPAILARWLMPNDIRPTVGHRFTFQAKPAEGWNGLVAAEVLAVEPERLLSYTWRGGSRALSGYGHYLDTVVTWTLRPTEAGTHLRLDHDGFPPGCFAYGMMSDEWQRLVTTCLRGNLDRLADRV